MTDTIPALKQSFLASQIRALSAPLSPPPNWRAQRPTPAEGDISDKVVDAALSKRELPFTTTTKPLLKKNGHDYIA